MNQYEHAEEGMLSRGRMPSREGLRPYARLRVKCGVAWFTTQAKATLSTGVMTVSTVSNITINVEKLGYDTSTATPAKGFGSAVQLAEDSGVALGPVSSLDGLTFNAPKTLRTGDTGDVYIDTDMAEVTKAADWHNSNDYVGYVKYAIHVEANADTGNPRTLKYKITPTVTDTELTAAYRVALYKASYSETTVGQVTTHTYTPGTKIGIYASAQGNSTGWNTAVSPKSGTTLSTTTYAVSAVTDVASATAISPAVTTANAISEYYIFSVWVEGCDTNATNAGISAATLQVDLEFSLE